MCLSFCGDVQVRADVQQRLWSTLELELQASCKLPNLGAGKLNQILWKAEYILNHETSLQPVLGQFLVDPHNFIHQMHAAIVYEDSKKALERDEESKTEPEMEKLYS